MKYKLYNIFIKIKSVEQIKEKMMISVNLYSLNKIKKNEIKFFGNSKK